MLLLFYWLGALRLLGVLGVCLGAAAILGQPCRASAEDPDDGECTFDWTPHYEELIRLGTEDNGGDSKTLRVEGEGLQAREVLETWYVAASEAADPDHVAPLYRLFSGTGDHMDDPEPDVPGYVLDDTLGHPWIAFLDGETVVRYREGTRAIRRYFSPPSGDHLTWLLSIDEQDWPPGYSPDATFWGNGDNPRLGYERFGQGLLLDDVVGSNGSGVGYGRRRLENSHMAVAFNHIWGNAIGRIEVASWVDGAGQPIGNIVDEPIGDMVQSVIRFARENRPGPPVDDPNCRIPNPTQSGGATCNSVLDDPLDRPYGHTEWWAGSPVLFEAFARVLLPDGREVQALESVVRPFDFCHNGIDQNSIPPPTGTDFHVQQTPWLPAPHRHRPLAWRGFLRRTDELGCQLGQTTRLDVLRTESSAILAPHHRWDDLTATVGNVYWLKDGVFGSAVAPASYTGYEFSVVDLSQPGLQPQPLEGYCLPTGWCPEPGAQVDPVDFTHPCYLISIPWCPHERNIDFPYAVLVSDGAGPGNHTVAFVSRAMNSLDAYRTYVWVRIVEAEHHPGQVADANLVVAVNRLLTQLDKTGFSSPIETLVVLNDHQTVLNRLSEIRSDDGTCRDVTMIFNDGFEDSVGARWSSICPPSCG
ncbi:MAG TPA: hypothetical protein VK969_01745 [Acidimicrobiia bacterium]|nr:hypothetical protein [Acidimicrobiia bacterium]